jgi:hypothetical protein
MRGAYPPGIAKSGDAARTSAQCHLVFLQAENRHLLRPAKCLMWGRLSTCGGLSTRLGGLGRLVGRRVDGVPFHLWVRRRLTAQCRILFPVLGMLQNLWGRFSTCGRFSIGLVGRVQMLPKRVKTRRRLKTCPTTESCETQSTPVSGCGKSMRHWADSLPHEFCSISSIGKSKWHCA